MAAQMNCPRCHNATPPDTGCAKCNPERLGERLRTALRDLAASQAREQELKKALTLIQSWTFPIVRYVGMWQPVVKSVEAALARPPDTSALREFGLKVARYAHELDGPVLADETIVDAVLEGK